MLRGLLEELSGAAHLAVCSYNYSSTIRAALRAVGRGERPAGRAELLAKKGAPGRMQRPTEQLPILYGPIWSVKVRVKVRIVAATA